MPGMGDLTAISPSAVAVSAGEALVGGAAADADGARRGGARRDETDAALGATADAPSAGSTSTSYRLPPT